MLVPGSRCSLRESFRARSEEKAFAQPGPFLRLSCWCHFLVHFLVWGRFFFAPAFALQGDDLRQVACDLQSFIVEEASTKAHLMEVLTQWDASSEMQVLVFNGHFATGKTYISNILAKALENIDVSGAGAASAHSERSVDHRVGSSRRGAASGTAGANTGPNASASFSSSGPSSSSGGSSSSQHVAIFVTEDSFISAEQFYVKIDDVLNEHDGAANGAMKIIVFDDLPCWRDTERITRVLTRCLQFSNKCRGTLFVITSNDGWCADDYCNRNSDLDRQFDELTDAFVGNVKKSAMSMKKAVTLTSTFPVQDLVQRRCHDVSQQAAALRELFISEDRMKKGGGKSKSSAGAKTSTSQDLELFAATEGLTSCALPGISLSREECEYRGCCCVVDAGDDVENGGTAAAGAAGETKQTVVSTSSSSSMSAAASSSGSFCDFCALEKSSEWTQAKLRKASSNRSGKYIAKGLSEFPHFVVLGANGMIFKTEALNHWGKLAERMLIQTFQEDDLPRLLQSQVAHAREGYGLEISGILLNFDSSYPVEFAKSGIEEVVAGEAPRNLRTSIKRLVRGEVKSQCLGGVCFLLKTKIQQMLMRQDQLVKAAGGTSASKKQGKRSTGASASSGGAAARKSTSTAGSSWTLSGLSNRRGSSYAAREHQIVLVVFLSPTETNPAQVAALSLSDGGATSSSDPHSDTTENKHVVDVQRFVSEGLGFHLRQLFHWGFADLIILLARKRRPEITNAAFVAGASGAAGAGARVGAPGPPDGGSPHASASASSPDGGRLATSGSEDDTSSSSAAVKPLSWHFRNDGRTLREQIEEIEKSWTAACPHHKLYDVKVVMPSSLPAECADFDDGANTIGGSGSAASSSSDRNSATFNILAPTCHFGNKDAHWCSTIDRRPLVKQISPNPFYGTILVRFQGHAFWKIHKWLTRSEQERQCDDYIENKWVFVSQVLVVPEWRHSQGGGLAAWAGMGESGSFGGHPVKPPEIASESKLGCLKEETLFSSAPSDRAGGAGSGGVPSTPGPGGRRGDGEL
eukprot:g723.t1